MENKKKVLLLLLLVALAVGIYFVFTWIRKLENTAVEVSDTELTLEEEKESLGNELNEEDHDLSLTIVSPEEETIIVGQERLYEAFFEGNGKYDEFVRCFWQFYINENSEEELFEEREFRGHISTESGEICGLTSTLVNKAGVLRVKLTMSVYDVDTDENIESVSGERSYTVL